MSGFLFLQTYAITSQHSPAVPLPLIIIDNDFVISISISISIDELALEDDESDLHEESDQVDINKMLTTFSLTFK